MLYFGLHYFVFTKIGGASTTDEKTAFLSSRCIRFALSSHQYALHLKHSTQELQLTLTSESYGMSGKGLCCTLLILDAQITCKNNKCFR